MRGHLTELHDFARLSREDLASLRAKSARKPNACANRRKALNRAKAEHRLAATANRQQLIDWQGQVAEMKRILSSSESRLDARQAAVAEAARQADATTLHLAEQAEQLRQERKAVSARRTEVERHLADMREWYRKKLRELASSRRFDTAASRWSERRCAPPRPARRHRYVFDKRRCARRPRRTGKSSIPATVSWASSSARTGSSTAKR